MSHYQGSKQAISGQPVTAIDNQHGPVHVAGGVRAEKYRGRFDVLDQAKATERDALAKFLLDWFRYKTLHAFGVLDRTGRDRVHANSIPSPFNREISSERVETSF